MVTHHQIARRIPINNILIGIGKDKLAKTVVVIITIREGVRLKDLGRSNQNQLHGKGAVTTRGIVLNTNIDDLPRRGVRNRKRIGGSIGIGLGRMVTYTKVQIPIHYGSILGVEIEILNPVPV